MGKIWWCQEEATREMGFIPTSVTKMTRDFHTRVLPPLRVPSSALEQPNHQLA